METLHSERRETAEDVPASPDKNSRWRIDIPKVIRLSVLSSIVIFASYYKGLVDGEKLQQASNQRYSKALRSEIETICAGAKFFIQQLRERQRKDSLSLTLEDDRKILEYYSKLSAFVRDHDARFGPDEAVAVLSIRYWMTVLKTAHDELVPLLRDLEEKDSKSGEKNESAKHPDAKPKNPPAPKKERNVPRSAGTSTLSSLCAPKHHEA